MNDPLRDAFRARLDATPEPSDLLARRTFAAIAPRERPAWINGAIAYAASVAIVVGGGTLVFGIAGHRASPPAAVTFARPKLDARATTVEHQARVVLAVRSIDDATRTMRSWPQVSVRATNANDRTLRLPSARYAETLARLAALGSVRQSVERTIDLATPIAQAPNARARETLLERLTFARIDVHFEASLGS